MRHQSLMLKLPVQDEFNLPIYRDQAPRCSRYINPSINRGVCAFRTTSKPQHDLEQSSDSRCCHDGGLLTETVLTALRRQLPSLCIACSISSVATFRAGIKRKVTDLGAFTNRPDSKAIFCTAIALGSANSTAQAILVLE